MSAKAQNDRLVQKDTSYFGQSRHTNEGHGNKKDRRWCQLSKSYDLETILLKSKI